MRALMNVIKDRHETYYARRKVPPRLQEAVARILDKDKVKQVGLKKLLGTKVLAESNVPPHSAALELPCYDTLIMNHGTGLLQTHWL
jgi:hypothetical protein